MFYRSGGPGHDYAGQTGTVTSKTPSVNGIQYEITLDAFEGVVKIPIQEDGLLDTVIGEGFDVMFLEDIPACGARRGDFGNVDKIVRTERTVDKRSARIGSAPATRKGRKIVECRPSSAYVKL